MREIHAVRRYANSSLVDGDGVVEAQKRWFIVGLEVVLHAPEAGFVLFFGVGSGGGGGWINGFLD